ncbi:MAG: hypothetical protein AAF830_05200 [Pseudomonadota bacterium]
MTKSKGQSLPNGMVPALLDRDQAADYVCFGGTTFDRLVAEGILPQPRLVGCSRRWLVLDLQRAVAKLPVAGEQGGDEWTGVEIDP